jgi:hypothetical protein
MTAATAPPLDPAEPADHGLLAALAIQYDKAGLRDRPTKLAHASSHVGRLLTSTAELTAEEARALRRHLRRCPQDCAIAAVSVEHQAVDVVPSPPRTPGLSSKRADPGCGTDGRHTVPDGEGIRSCPCGTVTRVPAKGRYCPPAICWCGDCPWWKPAPAVNYAAAAAALQEKTQRGRR